MKDCCTELNRPGSRLPTMKEAVEIVSSQMTRLGQVRQLLFMRETQGEKFAEQVKAKVVAAGGVRKK